MTRPWVVEGLGEAAFEQLAAELAGSELQSVLLEVLQRRAAARTPAEVLGQYQRDPFCRPAPIDQRVSVALDGHLLTAAAGFEAIELAPVAPLAACSSMGKTSQHRVLSALRATEVVADPTNVLALECAARLRRGAGEVHLATSHRVVRAQPVAKHPGYTSHFRIFVLATGGVETQAHGFTAAHLERHIRTMLDTLVHLERHGYSFGARHVDVLATPDRAGIGDRVAEALAGITVNRKPLDHSYYSGGLRYMIWVTQADGQQVPLVDGGAFDWLAQLASNRRAVYLASGAGAQLMALRFRVA